MKIALAACLCAVVCAAVGVIVSDECPADVEEYQSYRRPYSWYYPYNYKYYYPRPHYEGSVPSGGYMMYSNGTYFYRSY